MPGKKNKRGDQTDAQNTGEADIQHTEFKPDETGVSTTIEGNTNVTTPAEQSFVNVADTPVDVQKAEINLPIVTTHAPETVQPVLTQSFQAPEEVRAPQNTGLNAPQGGFAEPPKIQAVPTPAPQRIEEPPRPPVVTQQPPQQQFTQQPPQQFTQQPPQQQFTQQPPQQQFTQQPPVQTGSTLTAPVPHAGAPGQAGPLASPIPHSPIPDPPIPQPPANIESLHHHEHALHGASVGVKPSAAGTGHANERDLKDSPIAGGKGGRTAKDEKDGAHGGDAGWVIPTILIGAAVAGIVYWKFIRN